VDTERKNCLVVVVEDDDGIRESIRDVLEAEGHPVVVFRNGKEALDELDTQTNPCLILLDLMMPVMDGWQFMEARKHLPDTYAAIPVFIVSAVADQQKVAATGAAGYIRKPVDLDVLLLIVEKYCQASKANQIHDSDLG
jgi:CheY-like chemotaxis protein